MTHGLTAGAKAAEQLGSLWNSVTKMRLRWIILSGLAVRLLLMPLTSETYDVSVWYFMTNDMLRGLGVYSSHTFGYPPLWAYTMLPIVRALALFVNPASFSHFPDDYSAAGISPGVLQPIVSPLFLMASKLPLLLADLGGAYAIFKIVSEFAGYERGKVALALWLLNPAVIWTSFGHGQFDVIPAVLTLVSSYLLFRKHMVSSGAALSLAVFFKLYPLFLVPLYLLLLASRGLSSQRRSQATHVLRFIIGLAGPAVLFGIIPLVLPSLEGNGFVASLSSRASLVASMGGFSPFSILNLPFFFNLKLYLILNSQVLNLAVLATEFVLGIVIAWRIRKQETRDPYIATLHGHTFILAMVFLTSLLTNPQYIVWIMPFLVVLYGIKGEFLKRVWILSTLSFLFNLLWLGPGYFLYPSAAFLGIPSVSSLSSVNATLLPITSPAIALCQLIGFGTILSLFRPNLNFLRRGSETASPRRQLTIDPKLPIRLEASLELITLFLIASMAFVVVNASPPLTVQPNVIIGCCTYTHTPTQNQATLNLSFTGGTYSTMINTLLVPVAGLPTPTPLYIYYDPAYPTSLIDLRGWTGIVDHLAFELEQRQHSPNAPSSITTVNATGLARVVSSDVGSVVVIPSGVLPASVNITMLQSFLQKGGILFWIGDRIGYYSSPPSLALDKNSTRNPGYAAQKQLFNGLIVSENFTSLSYSASQGISPYAAGTLTTNLSRTLNLQYPETLVGATMQSLAKVGGTALGKVNSLTNQTSIAVIPVGLGKAIIFGGGVASQFASSGETEIAADIAQILSGAILYSTFQVAFLQEALEPSQVKNVQLTLTVDSNENPGALIFICYSPSAYVSFFVAAVYPFG